MKKPVFLFDLNLGPASDPRVAMIGSTGAAWVALRHWSRLLTAIFVLLLQVCATEASVTIDYTAQLNQRNVVTKAGNTLAEHAGEVRIGAFRDFFDPSEHGGDVGRIEEAWIPLGATSIRTVLGEPSRFSDSLTIDRPDLQGRKIYLWVVLFDGDGGEDEGKISEFGLYSSTEAHWVVPSEAALPPENATLLNSNQVDQEFGASRAFSLSLQLGVPDSGTRYEEWVKLSFPADASLEDIFPGADPDGDQLANSLEWITGNDPTTQSKNPLVSVGRGPQGIEITYQRSRRVAAGATEVETSFDLRTWARLHNVVTVLEVTPQDELSERITLLLSFDGGLDPAGALAAYFRLEFDHQVEGK